MKFKYFLLTCFVLLLSGCSFEYNVEITPDNIGESNNIYIENVNKSNIEKNVYDLILKYVGSFDELGVEKSKIIKKNDIYGMSFYRNFNFSDYKNLSTFSLCYDNYKIVNNGNRVVIATSKEFKCFDKFEELDDVIINITTDLDVISSNADYVDNNKYTWFINKDNANDKSISFIFDNNRKIKIEKSIGAFGIVVISLLVIGIIVIIIRLRGKRKNKI